jgi:hypothetical protein
VKELPEIIKKRLTSRREQAQEAHAAIKDVTFDGKVYVVTTFGFNVK